MNAGVPPQDALQALSAWIDASYPPDMDKELVLRRRVGKLMNESGEVAQAMEGYTGENPRKGVFDTREHVMDELLDVAITALGAHEHMDGNRGESLVALFNKINYVATRAGVVTYSAELHADVIA